MTSIVNASLSQRPQTAETCAPSVCTSRVRFRTSVGDKFNRYWNPTAHPEHARMFVHICAVYRFRHCSGAEQIGRNKSGAQTCGDNCDNGSTTRSTRTQACVRFTGGGRQRRWKQRGGHLYSEETILFILLLFYAYMRCKEQ